MKYQFRRSFGVIALIKTTYISSNLTHISIIALHVQMRINLFSSPRLA
jgi:hypothetical protein